jgi:hypothetical protein
MPTRPAPDGYITIPDAAKQVGVSTQGMYNIVLHQGKILYLSESAGSRTRYLLKKSDVDEYVKTYRTPLRGRPKKKADLYEIICICCGKLDVLYSTKSPVDLSRQYTRMIERDNKLVRIRVDGQLLTIHESDKLGNAYHPRMRKGLL